MYQAVLTWSVDRQGRVYAVLSHEGLIVGSGEGDDLGAAVQDALDHPTEAPVPEVV